MKFNKNNQQPYKLLSRLFFMKKRLIGISFLAVLIGVVLTSISVSAEEFKACSQDSDCKVDVCNENSCVNQSYQIPGCTQHNFAAKECHCVGNLCAVLVGSVAPVVPVCNAETSDLTYCKDEKTMMVCSSGNWVSKPCVYKCVGKECIAGCYKNEDCGSGYIRGYCSNNNLCSDATTLACLDYVCSSTTTTKCTPCANGCEEGRCAGETQQPTPPTTTPTPPISTIPTCKDSDGINFYQQGETCTEINCASDRCVGNAITIIEYYCNNNQRTIQDYGCPNGCKDGACIQLTSIEPKCSDTDGGLNYYEKGSTMWGSDISSIDSCEDEITLREEGCVINPGPNQGTMLTNMYKCPNGCKDGACIRGEKQREEVKCIFKGTETEQKCYRAEYNWMYCSSYQGSCIVTNLEGYDGEKITWKSTCGGYAYSVLDGNNKQIEFDCSGVNGSFCQSKQCDDGSWSKCYVDGSGYCVCTSCSEIIAKPVCGNGVCESGEGESCMVTVSPCEAGKECKSSSRQCKIICPRDCIETEVIYVKLNEKFKLQVHQPVKITDYKNMKMTFRDLITAKCEAGVTNIKEVKAKLTGYAVSETSIEPIEIIKCPHVGVMVQLEVTLPEEGGHGEEGKRILTLKLNEAKNIYDVSISFLDYDFLSRTGVFVIKSKTSTCPVNCICDSESYVIECKNETNCKEKEMLCPDGICREKCEEISIANCDYGCLYNNKCLPIGMRVEGMYCNIEGVTSNQLSADETCENNFECKTNLCIDGKCISSSLIKKVMDWLRKLFG